MRRKSIIAATGAALLFAVPINARAQQAASFLSFTSDPGDYIGQGQSRYFAPDTASFQSSSTQNNNHVNVIVLPFAGGFWYLDMAAPNGAPLQPGSYENAVRYPFQGAAQPGLSFYGDGRGCNTLTGRFDVTEAKYGPAGYVERFHANFEQHCEGGTAALFGEVLISNPPPPPLLSIDISLNGTGAVDRITGVAILTGTATCSAPTTLGVSGLLRQRANRFTLASGSFFFSIPCSATPTQVSVSVPPSGGVPFNPGMANVNVTASGFDPNYGTYVTKDVTAVVRLNR